jgi:hypothetical protein
MESGKENKSFYERFDELFKKRRDENDERYAFKKFEWMAELHNKILFTLIGVILLAVLAAILRGIGLGS